METKLRPITHIITSGTRPTKSYSKYKIVLEGTVRETGDPYRYCQWCKVGLGWNGNNPVYGSSYYTVESYDLVNGTYWATYSESNYPPSNLFVDNLYKKIDWTYNTGHKDDCYLEVIFNTNNAIVPTSIGLISPDNAYNYTQRPEYFKLYGWDNGWNLITTVNGEDTLSGDNAESIFNLSHTSSTIIRPVTIFENKKDSDTVEIFGKEYRTVTINGVTWLAENFAYDDGESNITTRILSDVNGYDLGTQYYYNLAAARRVANKVNGWHLASMNEWNSLVNYLAQEYSNNNKQALLASTYAWNNNQHGVDLGRMTCLPCGWINSRPALEGQQARFWVSDTDRDRNFYIFYNELSSESVELGWEASKSYKIGMSIRLVKD